MKDSVGGSILFYLVTIFTSIIILFFVGIISYSKAYKVKNKILEVIEQNNGYDSNVQAELNEELRKVGYRVISEPITDTKCKSDSSRGQCTNLNESTYYYCVCEQSSNASSSTGKTYEVITYVYFEFPIIGDAIKIPVKGETRVLNKNYDY